MPFVGFEKSVDVATPQGVRQFSIQVGPNVYGWSARDHTGSHSFKRLVDAQAHLDGLGEHTCDLASEVTKFAAEHRRKAPTEND
jgi:hypothetical protein